MAQTTPPQPDLSECEREPIRIPGSIQPHGFLLVLDDDLRVRKASANLHDFAKVSATDALEVSVEDVLIGMNAKALRPLTSGRSADAVLPIDFTLGGVPLRGQAHANGTSTLLEVEPHPADIHMPSLFAELEVRLAQLDTASDMNELLDGLADAVHHFSGFDRVMIYRFDADWNGEVLAERLTVDKTSYLGLRYPASDIPKQARELYASNTIRLIVDVDYTPVPLVPTEGGGEHTDLSDTILRSVSPVHLEYLRNMGATASMSLSLVQDGKLWGLIACHHHTGSRLVDHSSRLACQILARTGMSFIARLDSRNTMAERQYKDGALASLSAILDTAADPDTVLLAESGIMGVLEAQGAAIVRGEDIRLAGTTPDKEWISQLLPWLHKALEADMYAVHDLPAQYPPAAAVIDTACGLAAIRPSADVLLLAFRPEVARTVSWAGDPRKPVTTSADGPRISPRLSFERWKEVVRGTAPEWTAIERYALERLRILVTDILAKQAHEELVRINLELERKNSEIDSFAVLVSHDLQEPLRGMTFHAKSLLEEAPEGMDDRLRHKLERIIALCTRMKDLMDALLKYSRSATRDLEQSTVYMGQLVKECVEILAETIENRQAQVTVAQEMPTVECDPDKVHEVYINLLSNALKYDDGTPRIEIGAWPPSSPGSPWSFYVRDHGIGLDPAKTETAFTIFRRLHARDAYGGGNGAGLAIVRKIVERHGGSIHVEPTPGGGTTFVFTLAPDKS